MKQWIYQLAAPKYFYHVSGKLLPWIGTLCSILFVIGLVSGLLLAPADYQQGEGFRIIYVHVPSAILSMSVYVFMAIMAAVAIIWRIKLADILIRASAPIGAVFTFLALLTGSIWGKPMWGTWWVWDARLTSELILLFLYIGFIALQSAFRDQRKGDQAGRILLLVGVINIPIIHYSVQWWQTLHQGATISKFAEPSIAASMLYPLLIMLLAYGCLFLWVMLLNGRNEILQQESQTQWVRELLCNS